MSVGFPQVRIGEAVRYKSLSLFPLFDGSMTPVEYTLSDEDIGSGAVSVEEVSEAGSVPDLVVENKGDVRVLFLEGQELVGAKQNRVLNTSVLLAAHSKTKIPVSCVEQGRWGYKSRKFGSSGSQSSSKLRYFLKSSVSKSVLARRAIVRTRARSGKVWQRLLSGYVLDALEAETEEGQEEPDQAEAADVERLLEVANAMPWHKSDSAGEGEEYRASQGDEVHASALMLDGSPVHVSVVAAG
jgi:ARG and Rhodanese-Phosphatase-superfamily-associated Protein domain